MVTMYKIYESPRPERVGHDITDDDTVGLAQMKSAQSDALNESLSIVTWIVYRPDKIPVA